MVTPHGLEITTYNEDIPHLYIAIEKKTRLEWNGQCVRLVGDYISGAVLEFGLENWV